jgi:hypothetical protein
LRNKPELRYLNETRGFEKSGKHHLEGRMRARDLIHYSRN